MAAVQLYDSHVHLADERFGDRAEAAVAEFEAAGGRSLLAVSARLTEWERIGRLAGLPGVWGAVGMHPLYRDGWDRATFPAQLAGALAANPRLLAVGEIGLDFQYGREGQAEQEELFRSQLAVALAGDYPVLCHNRRSWREFFAIVREAGQPVRGVCHNFTGSRELAREVLDAGLLVSFAGPLTYPNARRARDAARYVPSDRLLVETDAPDLPPWGCRGRQSAPADVALVLAELAELRESPVSALADQVAENFRRFLRVEGNQP